MAAVPPPPEPVEPPSEDAEAEGVAPYHPTAATLETEERRGWSTVARWSAIGFEFAAAVGLFFLLGRYLDATWGTQPWLGVAGAGLGILLGMYVLIQKALRDEAASSTKRVGDDPDGPRRPGN